MSEKFGELPVGQHIILDLFDCQCDLACLDLVSKGISLMTLLGSHFNPLNLVSHQFEPHSYTAILLLEESHFSIHTWTQHRFASMDFYTCNGEIPKVAVSIACDFFKPQSVRRVDVKRGITERIANANS